jgi:hypothetical protein
MNQNLVGSILGRSSIKIAHFVPICVQTWPPQAILVSDWLISKKSKIKMLKVNGRWMPSSHYLWQGELKRMFQNQLFAYTFLHEVQGYASISNVQQI